MDTWTTSAAARVFAIPELLEHILTFLLSQLLPIADQEDPRSRRVYTNAQVLKHLLACTEVHSHWNQAILGSNHLKRILFLLPGSYKERSWTQTPELLRTRKGSGRRLHMTPAFRAPYLNPLIQTIFPAYHFRFWHLEKEVTASKYCAYLIILRRDIPAVHLRNLTGQGKSISDMQLCQPPCTLMKATIWEERDVMKEYVGKTTALWDPMIRGDEGITLGMVHERVNRMFEEHRDVTAIKIITV